MPTQDAADGNTGQPVPNTTLQVGGSDGTDLRTFATDASGNQIVVGPVASGVVVGGNPVLAAGYDGKYTQTLLTDGSGQMKVVGAVASGVLVGGDPVLVAGYDGYYTRTLATDSTGQLKVLVENSPAVLTLDQTVSGTITALDAVVGAPGGGGQMVTAASTAGSLVALNVAGVSSWAITIGSSGSLKVQRWHLQAPAEMRLACGHGVTVYS